MNRTSRHASEHQPVSVRPLQIDDALDLGVTCWPEIGAEGVYERVARALAHSRRGRAWPLVGLYQEAVVGFGQLARLRQIVEISDLIVGEGWQSRGVGTAIIRSLVDQARDIGFQRVEVGVAESNSRAHALYRRLGFLRLESHLLLDMGAGPETVLYLSRAL